MKPEVNMDAKSAAGPQRNDNQTNLSGKLAKESYDRESRQYFESIKRLPELSIEVSKVETPHLYLDMRNFIVLFIYETFSFHRWMNLLIFLKSDTKNILDSSLLVRVQCQSLMKENCKFYNGKLSDLEYTRKHPSVSIEDKNMIICGISSVLRFMLKFTRYVLEAKSDLDDSESNLIPMLKQLLGFRGGCLQACAESSIWTKFCEVDMVEVLKEIREINQTLDQQLNSGDSRMPTQLKLPDNLVRFEHHMSLPVKIHNFRKLVQDGKKADRSNTSVNEIADDLGRLELVTDLKHEFAEGPTMLLSDIILYPSISISISVFEKETFERNLPKCLEWHDHVHRRLPVHINFDPWLNRGRFDKFNKSPTNIQWSVSDFAVQSLYQRDTSRYKPTLRQFTRQPDIDETLELLKNQSVVPLNVLEETPNFKWDDIPTLAHPEGGSLPTSRRARKCDQLASLAHYTLFVYYEKRQQAGFDSTKRFKIVDFCSGGGHLGILVAYLLPECDIVLVENKDESLRRAQSRIAGLGLTNIFCYQSNLDYFESSFDLGLALHACGTATDLVLAKCVAVNASFVCCPCCYGAVQENHVLHYPRSNVFQQINMPLRNYYVLSHASDQTHDADHEKTDQGKLCMSLIDTDRCLYAVENKYSVKLCKIVPETASPKNHILVGISSSS